MIIKYIFYNIRAIEMTRVIPFNKNMVRPVHNIYKEGVWILAQLHIKNKNMVRPVHNLCKEGVW